MLRSCSGAALFGEKFILRRNVENEPSRSLKTAKLTRCKLGVFHLPVVGAAALVEPCVRGRAAVSQRAGAAAHGGVHGVKVLRTLEALVIIPIRVQPPMAVLPLCVRYPQVPGQISEQQAAQQAHHPGKPLGFTVPCVLWASAAGHRSVSVGVSDSSFGIKLLTEKPSKWIQTCKVMSPSSFHHPHRSGTKLA